jgi:hypothetical protein
MSTAARDWPLQRRSRQMKTHGARPRPAAAMNLVTELQG